MGGNGAQTTKHRYKNNQQQLFHRIAFLKPGLSGHTHLGLVNKLSSIFGWLRLRLAVSAKLGLPTSSPAFCFLASLVLAQPKTKPNFFTSP